MTNLIQRVGSVRWSQLVALLVVAFSVQAMAQFEIAPDHFDSNTSVEKKHSVKPATNAASTKTQGSAQNAVVAHNSLPATTALVGYHSSAASTTSTKKLPARRKKRAAERVALNSSH